MAALFFFGAGVIEGDEALEKLLLEFLSILASWVLQSCVFHKLFPSPAPTFPLVFQQR